VAEGAIDGGITTCGSGRSRSNPYWSGLNYVKDKDSILFLVPSVFL